VIIKDVKIMNNASRISVIKSQPMPFLFLVSDKAVKPMDQNETIQMRFKNGFKIMYKASKKFPKKLAPAAANKEKR